MYPRNLLKRDLPKFQAVFDKAIGLVRKGFPLRCNAPSSLSESSEHWAEYDRYQPHVTSLRMLVEKEEPRLEVKQELKELLKDDKIEQMTYAEQPTMQLTYEGCG